jgi:hypothetical protein
MRSTTATEQQGQRLRAAIARVGLPRLCDATPCARQTGATAAAGGRVHPLLLQALLAAADRILSAEEKTAA